MHRLIVLASVLLPAFLALASAAQAGDPGTPHYPDLQAQPPSEIRIHRDRITGQRLLRFSTTTANLGDGRLELRPVHNTQTGTTTAYQRFYTHDANGVWSLQSETAVGAFAFHLAHNHWHFDDFAFYELRSVNADGSIGALIAAQSSKVSFCIIDIVNVDSSLEHAAAKTYSNCGQNLTQGLTVGWGDVYDWRLDGQSLNVTNVPNGAYWLLNTADPDNHLAETDDSNNTAAVKITIKGNTAKVVQ